MIMLVEKKDLPVKGSAKGQAPQSFLYDLLLFSPHYN